MENREVIPTKSGPAGASRHQLSRQKKPLPSMRESLWPLRRREVNGSVPVLSRGLTYPRGEKLLAVMLSPSPRETTTPRRSAYRRSDPIYLIFCARLCLFGCLSTIWYGLLPEQSCSIVSAKILQTCGVRGRRRRREWRRRRCFDLWQQQQ